MIEVLFFLSILVPLHECKEQQTIHFMEIKNKRKKKLFNINTYSLLNYNKIIVGSLSYGCTRIILIDHIN